MGDAGFFCCMDFLVIPGSDVSVGRLGTKVNGNISERDFRARCRLIVVCKRCDYS